MANSEVSISCAIIIIVRRNYGVVAADGGVAADSVAVHCTCTCVEMNVINGCTLIEESNDLQCNVVNLASQISVVISL